MHISVRVSGLGAELLLRLHFRLFIKVVAKRISTSPDPQATATRPLGLSMIHSRDAPPCDAQPAGAPGIASIKPQSLVVYPAVKPWLQILLQPEEWNVASPLRLSGCVVLTAPQPQQGLFHLEWETRLPVFVRLFVADSCDLAPLTFPASKTAANCNKPE